MGSDNIASASIGPRNAVARALSKSPLVAVVLYVIAVGGLIGARAYRGSLQSDLA